MTFSGSYEDRLAIRELMDSYADAISRVDLAAYGACWADEGAVWSIPWYPEIGTIEGKDKILATWVEAMKTFAGDNFIMTPGSMRIEGDRAAVTAYTSECYDIGDTVFRDRGYYEDECVKVDGAWRYRKKTFHLTHRQTFKARPEDYQYARRLPL